MLLDDGRTMSLPSSFEHLNFGVSKPVEKDQARESLSNLRQKSVGVKELRDLSKKEEKILVEPKKLEKQEHTVGKKVYNEYFTDIYKSGDSLNDIQAQKQFYDKIFARWRKQDLRIETLESSQSLFSQVAGNIIWTFLFFVYNVMNLVFARDQPKLTLSEMKQTTMVLGFIALMPLIAVAFYTSLLLLVFPLTTLPMAIYLFFVYKKDKSQFNGLRRPILRYLPIWRHFVNYFPIRLVRTYELSPNKNYVFCYHPHGIISFGAFGNFATDASGFSSLFPGIDLRLLTLNVNFLVPFLREFLLWMGICSCSVRSCRSILSRKHSNSPKPTGNGIMIVVGGAKESMDAKPGTYRLTLTERKGFVRVALQTGAELVPVLGFGETDAYDTEVYEKNSTPRNLQNWFKKKFGFAVPIFYGRGIFSRSTVGILPHRKPIIAVVGKPLPNPSLPEGVTREMLTSHFLRHDPRGQELVDSYQALYIQALKALYDAYKGKFAANRDESLRIDKRVVPGKRQ
eukprot:maker-scaffold_73-snap-gene-0.5-mRNA-1 protein AED:0.01 eAED:0.01 QI:82/1/1/1/1/1/2/113/511